AMPGWAARRASATCSLCHRASGLLRVAIRSVVMRPLSPLKLLQHFAHGTRAAPTDFQRLGDTGQQQRHLSIRTAAQLGDQVTGNQAIAMDAQEARAELVLKRLQ